jgi:ABC-type polar amino acid transport system ATPase subunit
MRNQVELTEYQIKNEKRQELLHPLLEKANNSTIQTNENIRNTNENIRKSNKTLIIVFSITAFFTLITAIIAVLTYQLEVNKRNEQEQLKSQLLLIKQQNLNTKSKDDIIFHQKVKTDSLNFSKKP